ncbi:phospholipid transport system transporter-binding protein [Acinetobacter calcoaceticus]|uniref:Phospholipid transport system transporter-binding protein n=1 Tax=Acinetobacter calcoaceticus TaxID=471 RepID=A0A4R1Y5B7_ACICA|nr:phospholipid transport system transporter-binding protein [Acinetobacter calcoaceticus]
MIEFKNRQLHVSGEINFANAETVYLNGLRMIQQQDTFPVTVNLSALQSPNTLALAVVIRWLRQTPDVKGLVLKAVPEKMTKIIQSCHLENDLQII